MASKLENYTQYTDGQLIQIPGPDGHAIGYQYDQESRSFYTRETILTAGVNHGSTHISSDLIPSATPTTPGLLSANDKNKLDSLAGVRLGVLGFQGAGFPDDGGWMQGDIILSSGSEFISLERTGNVIRFTVDVPAPFACGCEECLQIFWVQDETDVNAVRPPTCGGQLPGVNAYGEMKVYLFPSNTIVNPNSTSSTLNNKGNYPSFIFKRYDDGSGANEAELDIVLKRNSNGTTHTGMAFTPGANDDPEFQVFLGLDENGSRINFKLGPESETGLLGSVLYKGHSITKQMGIITGYESSVLTTNQYKFKLWSLENLESVGSEQTVTNIRQWNTTSDTIVTDSSTDSVLLVGQTIDVWSIKIGSSTVYYCKEDPIVNTNGLWAVIGSIQFGDEIESRVESDLEPTVGSSIINDISIVDPNEWGVTNLDDPILLYVDDATQKPISGRANYTALIVNEEETSITRKHLEIVEDIEVIEGSDVNAQRPIHIWNRTSMRDAYIEIHFARPDDVSSDYIYPPIDILLRAPINVVDSKYAVVTDNGTFSGGQFNGLNYIKLVGIDIHDLPPVGAVKVIHKDGSFTYGQVFSYTGKLIDSSGGVYIAGSDSIISTGSVCELLHADYTSPAIRLNFDHDGDHDIAMTPVVGTLSMNPDYEYDNVSEVGDNLIRDFEGSPLIGSTYWQDGEAELTASEITSSEDGFVIYNGGVNVTSEVYNVMRIMTINDQVWIWWNDLLLPYTSDQPYFTIVDQIKYGKFGLRLWPGAKLRRFIVRSKIEQFSEFTLGQLSLS